MPFLLTVMPTVQSDVLDMRVYARARARVCVFVCVYLRVILLFILFLFVQFSTFLQWHFFGFTSMHMSTCIFIKIVMLRTTIFP